MNNVLYRANLSIIKQALTGALRALKSDRCLSGGLVDYGSLLRKIGTVHEASASDDAVYEVLYNIGEPWVYLSTRNDILSEEHRKRALQLATLGQMLAYDISNRERNYSARVVAA